MQVVVVVVVVALQALVEVVLVQLELLLEPTQTYPQQTQVLGVVEQPPKAQPMVAMVQTVL
jgi:hypothetical protein